VGKGRDDFGEQVLRCAHDILQDSHCLARASERKWGILFGIINIDYFKRKAQIGSKEPASPLP